MFKKLLTFFVSLLLLSVFSHENALASNSPDENPPALEQNPPDTRAQRPSRHLSTTRINRSSYTVISLGFLIPNLERADLFYPFPKYLEIRTNPVYHSMSNDRDEENTDLYALSYDSVRDGHFTFTYGAEDGDIYYLSLIWRQERTGPYWHIESVEPLGENPSRESSLLGSFNSIDNSPE